MGEIMPHWLTRQAYLSPNEVAIELKTGEKITFLQLKYESEQFARKLVQQGVKSGDHVAIYSTNCPEMIIALHAFSYLGVVAVLLNTRLTKSELSYQINDANVKRILTSDNLFSKAKKMKFTIPIHSFAQIMQLSERDYSLKREINLNDTYTIIYTSGTTGHPKGVVHTYGNHWWSAIGSALNLGLQEKDKWLAVLPLFHVGGFSICIRSVIYGIPVYLLDNFIEEDVNNAIISHGVTIASVVTVMLQRLTNNLGSSTYPDTFRCMLLGGGPVPKPLLENTKKKCIPVFQSYGLTETSSQIVTLSAKNALNKLGSAGKPLFPGQLEIRNQNREGVGDIYVRGPMVTNGYYNKTEANNEAFKDGWFITGDLGYQDQDGFLYIVDRRTDLIISGGENIYPSEIESILSGMKSIKEVGVVGKPNNQWGEVPVAFVVRNNETITKEEIIKYAKRFLAGYKVPNEIYFLTSLPRTASNKLIRHELKKYYT